MSLQVWNTRREISCFKAAIRCSIHYIKTNEIPNLEYFFLAAGERTKRSVRLSRVMRRKTLRFPSDFRIQEKRRQEYN